MSDNEAGQGRLSTESVVILEGRHCCDACGHDGAVFGLMALAPFDVEGEVMLDPDDDSVLLQYCEVLPPELGAAVQARSSGRFQLDISRTAQQHCFMNHCESCGAKIGDWFVYQPGAAFFPTTQAEMDVLQGQVVKGRFDFLNPECARPPGRLNG